MISIVLRVFHELVASIGRYDNYDRCKAFQAALTMAFNLVPAPNCRLRLLIIRAFVLADQISKIDCAQEFQSAVRTLK